MTDIVYATTNPGKFAEVEKLFAGHNIKIHSAIEYNADLDVDETGTTLEENAILKAEAYLRAMGTDVIVIGDDTGLEIDALGGEPGIKVRRWKGYKMADEEIVNYCLERMKEVPEGKRNAQFRTVIAVAKRDVPIKTFSATLPGRILTKPIATRFEGLPFQPLFFSTEYQMMLGEISSMPIQEKIKANITTHRERAVTAALPYLATLTQ